MKEINLKHGKLNEHEKIKCLEICNRPITLYWMLHGAAILWPRRFSCTCRCLELQPRSHFLRRFAYWLGWCIPTCSP